MAVAKKNRVYLGPDIPAPAPPPVVKHGDHVDPENLPEPLAAMVKANPDFKKLMVRPGKEADGTRLELQQAGSKVFLVYREAAGLVRRGG